MHTLLIDPGSHTQENKKESKEVHQNKNDDQSRIGNRLVSKRQTVPDLLNNSPDDQSIDTQQQQPNPNLGETLTFGKFDLFHRILFPILTNSRDIVKPRLLNKFKRIINLPAITPIR